MSSIVYHFNRIYEHHCSYHSFGMTFWSSNFTLLIRGIIIYHLPPDLNFDSFFLALPEEAGDFGMDLIMLCPIWHDLGLEMLPACHRFSFDLVQTWQRLWKPPALIHMMQVCSRFCSDLALMYCMVLWCNSVLAGPWPWWVWILAQVWPSSGVLYGPTPAQIHSGLSCHLLGAQWP